MADSEAPKHIKSVSAGGESVTIDHNSKSAEERANDNDNLTNIANRRVRPYFVSGRITRVSGW